MKAMYQAAVLRNAAGLETLQVESCSECPCRQHSTSRGAWCGLIFQVHKRSQHRAQIGCVLTRGQASGEVPPPDNCPLRRPHTFGLQSSHRGLLEASARDEEGPEEDTFANRMQERRKALSSTDQGVEGAE